MSTVNSPELYGPSTAAYWRDPPPEPKTPIDGFKVNVPADELREHFKKRLGYHVTALKKLEGNRIKLIGVKGETSDIIQKHRMQMKLLTYLVDHIPAGEVYRLTLNELDGLYVLKELTDE